jgi:tetratricopeptide (TPR) repeat protein
MRARGPGLPLGLGVVAVWLAWAWFDGGFEPSLWGPLGAALVALLLVGSPALAVRGRSRVVLAAAAALLLFCAWNFLSLLWAQFPSEAWTGADKTVAYTACLLVLLLARLDTRALPIVLGTYAAGVIAIGAAVLVRAAEDPERWFADSRLVPPTGYTNASVALWTLALWPALYLGCTRAGPAVLRPFFLAGATLLLELGVLGQSRAWIVVLPLAAVVFVATSAERLRSTFALALVATAALIVLRPLLDVYGRGSKGVDLATPVHRAATAIALSCAGTAAVTAVWTALETRGYSPRVGRAARVAVVVVLLAGATAGGAWAAARVDHPGRALRDRWHEFTCQTCSETTTATRFGGSASDNRYGEWLVAWKTFRRHPLEGAGSDNYAAEYLLLRRDALIEPRYPHSTPLRLLSELGVVGTVLFAAAAALLLVTALRGYRRLDPLAAGAVGAALTSFAYWLLHGSLDWFWEIPALSGPAFGLLGLAAGTVPLRRGDETRRLPLPATIAAGALAAAAIAALVLPWLSYRYEKSGASVWARDPALAYRRLQRAADLEPLAARPLVVQGAIALRLGDEGRARRAFRSAVDREPETWYAWLELGLVDASTGRRGAAGTELARARALNPRDPVVALAQRLLRRGVAVEPDRINGLYAAQERRRFGI